MLGPYTGGSECEVLEVDAAAEAGLHLGVSRNLTEAAFLGSSTEPAIRP